ncbi:MAG: VWA domain-containing protein [Verrucomicrobiota bacterium]|nr:VWA domain-containing protein [Verrucomicrobiota bacterium]
MNFVLPKMLWLGLAVTILLGGFLWWSWRRKQSLIEQFISARLLPNLAWGVSKPVEKARLALVTLAALILFLALARPQWGMSMEEATFQGRDILVAIDTSRSMLADDVKPNRLQRAKLAALDLLRVAKSDRLGLIAFAGTAFLQCPLTLDDEAFRQSVEILDAGIIPQGGTAIGNVFTTALETFEAEEHAGSKILILITDAEDHEGGIDSGTAKLSKAGIRIFTIGVGTASGELIRQTDQSGKEFFLKDAQGNVVKSRLNESLLTKIAEDGGGFYLNLQQPGAMEQLYNQGIAEMEVTEGSARMIQRMQERFQWPLAVAVLLLFVEILLPGFRSVKSGGAVAKTVALLLLIFSSGNLSASPAQAYRDFQQGRFAESRAEYERLAKKKPDDPRFNFNAGSAAYKEGSFDSAIRHFSSVTAAQDLELQQKAYYNLGNSNYQLGAASDPERQMALWEEAIKNYDSAIKLNPQDKDAAHNRELVRRQLEELKKQQQQQQQQQNKGENQKQDNQQQNQSEENSQQQDKQDNSEKKEEKQEKSDNSNEDKSNQQEQQSQQEQSDQNKQNEQQQSAGSEQQNAATNPGEEKESQASSSASEKPGEEEQSPAAQMPVQLGKMNPQQARQLLEAQKGEEKVLLFVPPQQPQAREKSFKDW